MDNESEYTIVTGSDVMQIDRIHWWLSEHSYWARGIPKQTVATAIKASFCVGVFHKDLQIGFARFITDYAVFAYLADVYIEEEHRRNGLSKRIMETLMIQPWINGVRRIMLATKDAHGLYEHFGFQPLRNADRIMEIFYPDMYVQAVEAS